tara:strand:- start:151 stop:339 length:189 start_codon:yes stop_codon:yes gene_type:complete
MGHYEDELVEIYNTVVADGIKKEFDNQLEKMARQDKHSHKSAKERWSYALYRIKGGPSLDKY